MLDSDDIKELRKLAIEYYKEFLSELEVENIEIGIIKFTKSGYKKPISLSADVRKLKVFPLLKELIETATLINIENDRYDRLNTKWYYLGNSINKGSIEIEIIINVRKDCNGILYYNHCIIK